MTTDVTRPDAIRVGVLGAGFMAEVHSRAARVAGGRLVAGAASTPGSGARAAARLGLERAHATADDLLADPSIDLVHICTPNATHADFALRALAAGKHVICEKPLATASEVAALLVETAAGARLAATVPFVYRYHPMVREARARVAAGSLGRVLSIQGAYLQDWMLTTDDDDWRVDPLLGGPSRAFADIGSHLCDLVEFVTGDRIAAVNAVTRTVHADRATHRNIVTEDLAAVLVTTRAGAVGTLLISQVAPGRKNALTIEIAGTGESVRFEQEQPESLWVGRRSGSQLLQRDPLHLHPQAARLSPLPAGHPLGYQDAFNAFVADSYTAVHALAAGHAGELPDGLPTFADGMRQTRITEAVLSSAASGQWVEVKDADPDAPRLDATTQTEAAR